MQKAPTRVLIAALVTAASLMACSDDEKDCPTCAATPTPPAITDLTASATMVAASGTVNVSVQATGEELTYLWSATGGSFAADTQASTVWTAPSSPGVHNVTVTVTGKGNLTASRSKAVGVEMSLALTASATSVTVANQVQIVARAVGDGLVYRWYASDGVLREVAPDTALWRAPDAVPAGPATIRVFVGDEAGNARSEEIQLAVVAYTPEVSPAYKGADYCGTCHADARDDWGGTAHAGAWSTLAAYGSGENGFCLPCHTVGAMGLEADRALSNGGYDEIPLAALRGVQCENCHGAGSTHPTDERPKMSRTLDAAMCGSCHNGTHHPTFDEWSTSLHGHALELEDPVNNVGCVKCHNGAYAYRYLDDPRGWTNPTEVTEHEEISCGVCHDPHSPGNPGQLRDAAVTDVVLPDGTVVPEAGAGRLCMACHNGRRTPTNMNDHINNGSGHFGPHHSNQGDMLAGTGAYEDLAPGFTFVSSRHLEVEDGCVNCHTHPHAGDPENGGSNFTGHTFTPTVEACQPCHGTLESFAEVMAKEDYDGDGTVEGVQEEVDGLLESLHDTIVDACATDDQKAILEADFSKVGDVTVTTVDQRKAGWNYFFVANDSSHGVHNAKYSIQLLQQSILFLDPGGLPRRSFVLVE